MQVRKQQLELDMEQQTGSKYEKVSPDSFFVFYTIQLAKKVQELK